MLAAPVDRRRGAERTGEDAGDGGAGLEDRQQDVGAAPVANPGLGGGEAHAGNGGRNDVGLGGEGGDGQGHGGGAFAKELTPSCASKRGPLARACMRIRVSRGGATRSAKCQEAGRLARTSTPARRT